jgi:hypothetical protein
MRKEIIAYANQNRTALERATAMYKENPAEVRNAVAELGMELTPVQIRVLVETIECMLADGD